MRSFARLSRSVLVGLIFGLLFTAGVGTLQTAPAQQPVVNLDQPVQSFEQAAAAATSEARLLDITTAWMKARADTKIRYSTYQKGVRILKNTHPDFYGNFFGDPFYATYDADYFRMARLRYLASLEVNPFNGLSGMFFCNPLGYDPAFNGRCRGITFAAFDFFLLPPGFGTATASTFMPLYPWSSTVCPAQSHSDPWCTGLYAGRALTLRDRDIDGPRFPDERPERPDTVRTGIHTPSPVATAPRDDGDEAASSSPTASIDGDLSSIRMTPIQTPDRPAAEINVPDNAHESIQKTVSSLRQTERTLRLRRYIRQQYGSRQSLTPEERARLASEFADRSFAPDDPRSAWSHPGADDTRPRPRATMETSHPDWSQPRSTSGSRRPAAEDSDARTSPSTDRRSPQRRTTKPRDTETSENQ